MWDLIEAGMLTGAGTAAFLHIVGKLFRPRSVPVYPTDQTEKRCTGYRLGRGAINKMMDDCTALRSEDCKDGRCTYHCEQMCRCTTALGLR